MKVPCPACGAEVQFRSRASIFGVCNYCQSSIALNGIDPETIGKMSEMPQDMSPLQIGTRGKFQNKNFEIVGRQKVGWDAGSWNEWYCLFDDGRDGWLADAQGFYMLSFQVREACPIPAKNKISVGTSIDLLGKTYVVDDLRTVKALASEGELAVRSQPGRESTSVDLSGPNQSFASIDYGPEEPRLFIGSYGEFEEFQFSHLREFDGW